MRTTHELRKVVLARTGLPIHSKKDYLKAVKFANDAFKNQGLNHRIQYLREFENKPYGLVITFEFDEHFMVGGSVCDPDDTFNKELALFYALWRPNLTIVKIDWSGAISTDLTNLPIGCRELAYKMINHYFGVEDE